MPSIESAAAPNRPWQFLLRWGVLLTAALIFQAPTILFNRVVPFAHDFSVHYNWAVEFADAFQSGDFYPRWMGRANFGLGEPALLFYSPLYYVWTALLRPLTGNSWDAMRQVMFLSTLVTGFYGYRLLRNFAGEYFALLGAVCLQFSPVIEMLFGYLDEIPWAASFPVLVATLYYATRPGAFARLIDLPVALCTCFLVMSHLLAALMMTICLSCCFLPYIRIGKGGIQIGRTAWAWVLSVTFGLLLSSVYLLPALASLTYISPATYFRIIHLWSAFSFPAVTWMLFGIQWFAFQWVSSGAVLFCVLVATWFAVHRSDRSDRMGLLLRFLLIAAWSALFLSSELSFPLWMLPVPLRMLQFPHRFIYIASAAGMLADLLIFIEIAQHGSLLKRVMVALPLLLCVALTGVAEAKIVLIDGRVVHLTSDDRSLYDGLPEYDLKTAGNGWRNYVKGGGFERDCRDKGLRCEEALPTGDRLLFHITAPAAGFVRLPLFAFPAWQATVDAVPAQMRIDRGLASVALPKGSHTVLLTWRRLPQEVIGFWLTLLSIAAGLGLAWWHRQAQTPAI